MAYIILSLKIALNLGLKNKQIVNNFGQQFFADKGKFIFHLFLKTKAKGMVYFYWDEELYRGKHCLKGKRTFTIVHLGSSQELFSSQWAIPCPNTDGCPGSVFWSFLSRRSPFCLVHSGLAQEEQHIHHVLVLCSEGRRSSPLVHPTCRQWQCQQPACSNESEAANKPWILGHSFGEMGRDVRQTDWVWPSDGCVRGRTAWWSRELSKL